MVVENEFVDFLSSSLKMSYKRSTLEEVLGQFYRRRGRGCNFAPYIHNVKTRKAMVQTSDGSIDKGLSVVSSENQKTVINFKEVLNLEDEVAKVLEKGLALNLDFNGRKELIEIIAWRKEENDNSF
ncbi:hypothetical protein LWI28_016723 [Acer negundo]|uniref:Uncharacterized protein n=1 Tax=Acer negundo TaxID=4023 RepID=A0AAD5J6N6_ACENE|nr:hypothetical protein LWI28_016723 [Acer negundo]